MECSSALPVTLSTASRRDATDVAHAVLEALEEGKAQDIVDLDVTHFNSGLIDRMLACTVSSARHGATVVDLVRVGAKQAGAKALGVEGCPDSSWRLIDLRDIIVHIMTDDARRYIELECLWAPIGT